MFILRKSEFQRRAAAVLLIKLVTNIKGSEKHWKLILGKHQWGKKQSNFKVHSELLSQHRWEQLFLSAACNDDVSSCVMPFFLCFMALNTKELVWVMVLCVTRMEKRITKTSFSVPLCASLSYSFIYNLTVQNLYFQIKSRLCICSENALTSLFFLRRRDLETKLKLSNPARPQEN